MDKNMIKIDDLLKQRLGDAEEHERAGAWTNMRDLLDQQMPTTVAASTNWRRMLVYVAGILVLATVAVGGYEMVDSFSGSGTNEMAMNSSTDNNHSGIIATATAKLPEGATANTVNTVNEENSTVATPAPVQQTAVNHNSAAASTPVMAGTSNKPSVADKETPQTTLEKAKAVIPSSGNNNQKAPTENIAANAPVSKDVSPAQTAQTAAETQNVVGNDNGVATNNQNNNTNQNSNNPNKIGREKEELSQMPTSEPQLAKNDVDGPQFDEERREVRLVEMRKRLNENGELEKDTMSDRTEELVIRTEKQQTAPSAGEVNTDEDDNSGSNIMPASAAPSDVAQANSAADENNGNVDSRGGKNKYKNPRRFEELVKNAKVRMGKMKFYPGVIAGANTSFSKTNISGFNLGFAGKLTIDERWSILTEAKYLYRFNGKERLQDDYITNVKSVAINGQSLLAYDSVEHYYNFNNYGSIELPIAVNYNLYKRFDVFGGVNMTYNFKINNLQEVELIHSKEAGATSTNVNVSATDKSILLSDFKPSFGLGYVAGVGLQATNNIRLDLRVTQPLLMRTKTTGQQEIADRLYKMPNVQFNMTFKFGGNKYKPYKKY